jgi:hypothetical protein
MLRVEWVDYNHKWHTYFVSGTSIQRTKVRELRKLTKLHHEIVRKLAVCRV